VRSYISNKIEHCKAELMHALDRNDYLSAIKLRAVQKEFEDLLNAFDSPGNALWMQQPFHHNNIIKPGKPLLCWVFIQQCDTQGGFFAWSKD